jgi:hypothetical protein
MSQHIDWREIALKAFLADGKVDEPEIAILKKELKASTGNYFQEGVTFLVQLRDAYTRKAKAKKEALSDVFENFFFKVVQDNVLKDGAISDHEAGWLRETLFADGKIDDREWTFMQTLDKKAKEKSNAWIQLFADCQKKRGGAAAKEAKPATEKKEKKPKKEPEAPKAEA